MTDRHGDFVWYDLMTRDPAASERFFTSLFSWTVESRPDASGAGAYRMLIGPAGPFGAVVDYSSREGDHPSYWIAYLGVPDVDEMVERIQGLGGHVGVPGTDIPTLGRFAVVSDAQRAWFSLYTPASDEGTLAGHGEDGTFDWAELATSDVASAMAFYAECFGWSAGHVMEQDDGSSYHFLMRGEDPIAGVSQRPDDATVSAWTHYVRVRDVDTTAVQAQELGGAVIAGPLTVPGLVRFAVLADPAGAAFGVFCPLNEG